MVGTPLPKIPNQKRRHPGGWPSSSISRISQADIVPDDCHTISSAGNMSVNTLAAFLIDSASQNDASSYRIRNSMTPTSTSLDVIRQKQIENQALINALNQFILQAGNIYKGKKLSDVESDRLRDAAIQAGLSMKVVDALLEQTANPNAVVEYCMKSDDTFARKIKEHPQLSRMLKNGNFHAGGDGLNLTSSIWRVFMHKIIQQFLKQQNMQLQDVMDKSSLTSRLYDEAFRDDPPDLDDCENIIASLPRDYTEERKHVHISEDEAKKARMEAEAKMSMSFQSRAPFDDLMNRNSMLFLPRNNLIVESRDDDLSIAPCAEERERDGPSPRRKSMPAAVVRPKVQRIKASDGQVSAVKRGLAIFEKTSEPINVDVKKVVPRRKSEGNIISGNVLKARQAFEKGNLFSTGTDKKSTSNSKPENILPQNLDIQINSCQSSSGCTDSKSARSIERRISRTEYEAHLQLMSNIQNNSNSSDNSSKTALILFDDKVNDVNGGSSFSNSPSELIPASSVISNQLQDNTSGKSDEATKKFQGISDQSFRNTHSARNDLSNQQFVPQESSLDEHSSGISQEKRQRKVSKLDASRLATFSSQENTGGLSDTTVTSLSKERRRRKSMPEKVNSRSGFIGSENSTESSMDIIPKTIGGSKPQQTSDCHVYKSQGPRTKTIFTLPVFFRSLMLYTFEREKTNLSKRYTVVLHRAVLHHQTVTEFQYHHQEKVGKQVRQRRVAVVIRAGVLHSLIRTIPIQALTSKRRY